MNKYQRIGIRVAISTNVGILVAAVAIVIAWRDTGHMSEVRPEQWATHQAMGEIDGLIQIYRNATKTLPTIPKTMGSATGHPNMGSYYLRDN